MVDLSVGINAQNLSSAGVVVAVQGVVNNIANGELMQAGMAVNLGDAVQTAKNASIVIRFLEGGALAMGANQSAVIDEGLIDRLQTFEESSEAEEDMEFASLVEALERGESIEELLPATAAGGDGAGGSSLGNGVRFEYTGGQVLPQAGFGSGAGAGGASALGDGFGAGDGDGNGIPAPGELSLAVVQDANGDGFINIAENDGQITVSIALPDGLLPGSSIVVNGVVVGLTQADIEAGSVAVNLPLPEDGETLEISATPFNPAGVSGETATTSITVDITPPLLTVDPLPPTNDTTPTISGTGEPGNQVTITDPTGKVIGTTTVDPDGNWEIIPTDPIDEPGTDVTVSTVDPAGNESTEEENIVIDTTPPGGGTEKPTVSIPEAESGVNKEEIENGIQVIVGLPSGTGPGDTVVVTVTLPSGETIDVTSVVEPGEEGSKEVTVPVNVLPSPPDGNYVVQVTVVDPAGNVSLPSDPVDFIIDTIAPGEGGEITAPIVTIPEAEDNVDEEELEDGVQVQIVLPSGTEPGDKVTVKVTLPSGGTEEIEYIVGPEDGGSVEVTIPTSILPEPPGGEYQVVVDVTDKAGNTSEPSTPEPFVIDIVDETPPPQPSISFVEDANKDGYFNFDESTANVDAEIDVVVTLDPNTPIGSVLTVTIDGANTTVAVTQQLLNEGQLTITVPQPNDGSVLSVVAKVTSEAGVDSPNAEGSLIVDVTDFKGANPGLSVELSTDANNDGTINSAESLNASRAGGVDVLINLPAGAKAGDKLIVSVTGQSPREIIVSDTDIGNGTVQFTVDALGHGQTLEVQAQIFDAAGNVSEQASDSATMNLQPMRSPAIVFVDDSSGDGEVNKEEVGTKTELTVDIILPAGVEPGDKLIVVVDGSEREIPITQQIIDDKKVSITVPTPGDGETVNVKAKVEDPTGESGPESEKEVEMKVPELSSGLSVSILEDSDDDGELSTAELNGSSEITVEVTLPNGAKEGDTLILEVNNVPQTITITDAHVQSGSIEVLTAAPAANQTIQVKAEVFDAAGNSSEPATDSVSMAASTVSGAPSVNFTDDLDGNGFLNAAESAGLTNLSIQFDLPAGLSDGDKLIYQLNGGTPITLDISQADIDAGFVSTSSLVPQSGTTVAISSHVEQAGVAGPTGQGQLIVDTSDLSALNIEIVEDLNNDGFINAAERQGALDVRVDLPADAAIGDRLVLISNSGAPRAYTLTSDQVAAGELVVSYDMPADGVTFEVKATLSDAAGNTSGEVSDSAQIDVSGLDAPIITFVDDNSPGDGLLNDGELAGKPTVSVEIALPIGTQIDDVLVYSVDGGPEQTIVIDQSHIDAGLVSISLPIPQDGATIEVAASVRDKAGNDGELGQATVSVDLSDLNSGLSINILEDADDNGVISIAEQDGAVDVRIGLPAGAQVGDSLRVEAAANTPTLITITADHLSNGYVDVSLNSVSQGNDFVVTASISDAAGNSSDPVSASALVEGKAQVKPGIRIVEDANNDGKIVANELNGDVDVEVTLPASVQPGDNVVLKTNTGQELSQIITQADIDRGSITFQVDPVADGETLSLESYIENSDGEAGESAAESVDFVTSSSSVPFITSIYDDVDPIVGKMASGAISNDPKPQLQGIGERGDVINIYLDGVLIGKTDVRDDGSWAFDVQAELAEDDYVFTVSSTNSDGNESAQSAPFNYTVDLTAPTAIINFVGEDDVGPVTGPISDGDTIDDSVPTFSGRAEPGTTINVYDNGKLIATGIEVGPNGNWTFEPSPALANGAHAISVTAVDSAGNESDPVGPLGFVIDTASPGSPSIVRVLDDVGNEDGRTETISPDGVSNDSRPTVEGTGPIGATISVYDKDPSSGGVKIGEAVVDGEGKWTFTPADGDELADGTYEFYADASIAGGPASAATGPYIITVDTVAPDKPGTDSLNAEDDIGASTGPINNGETTDDSKPRLHGKVDEPNGKVVITIDPGTDNERVVTVDVDDEGNWEYTPEPPLVDGPHSVQIAVIDEAGNGPGDPSDPLTFTVDTSDITVSIDKAVDDVPTPGEAPGTTKDINDGGQTNDLTPLIVGSAKVGAEVTLEVNGKTYGPVTADGDGVWSIQITDDLPEGAVEFTATAKDAAGNDVEDTFTLNIDVTASPAPIINDADDNVGKVQGKLNSGDHTDDNTPKINGTGTAGETIRIYKDGDVVDEVKVKGDGSWTYTPTDALPEGEHTYTATSVDPAGNESQPSDPFVLTIDRTNPDAVENFKGFDDVGLVVGDIVNNSTIDDAVPEFTGEVAMAEFDAGSTVTVIIRDGGGQIVQTIEGVVLSAGANVGDPATWSASPSPALGNGSFTVTAKVVDKAGNESDESSSLNFDINTASPGSPSIVRVLDDVGNEDGRTETISPDGVSNDSRPTVEGTGPIGATISVYDKDPSSGGVKIGEAVVDGEGKWTFTPAVGDELADGTYEFYADASIAGGPASAATGPYIITVDTVAPDKPGTDSLNAEDDIGASTGPINNGETTDDSKPRLHGKVDEPNGKVVITIDPGTDNERVVTVDVDDEGNWEYTPEPPLVDGPHSVQIAVIDEAGNGPGDPSDPLTFTVDTSDITVSIDKAVDDVPTPGEAPGTTKDINDGGQTNDLTPLIVGSAKVGAEVTLEVNGKTYGPVTADGDGVWSIQITDDLPEGAVEFTATAKDAAGNDVEDTFTLNIDVTASPAPIINDADDNVGKVQGKLNSGDHTDDNTPKINGTGTAGETIRIYKDGDVVDEVKVKGDGSWTYTPTDALPEGEHTYTATSVDPAGNESQPSDPFVLTVDRTSPDDITDFMGFDDVGLVQREINDGDTIDDATPTFSGEVNGAEVA
uniref:retention module-containing protein n=1 Tax=uncultured Pseudoteredinibacter sp. TaxID=1641701 RepID=UPI0026224B1C